MVMDSRDLQRLLSQEEGPTLEFKREWYKLDDPNHDTKKRQRGELVKDVLSLANGNASVAGEPAYLIIGVDDKLDESGCREIFGIGELDLTVERIRQIVNTVCEPPLENILGEMVPVNDKRVFVITIPPSLHLYETTRRLDTCSEHTFTEHVVFIRSKGNVEIASSKDRVAISKMKELRFKETRKAPPVRFGAAIGAIACGWTAATLTKERTGNRDAAIGAGIGGALVGGILGGSIGRIYTYLVELKSEWHRLSVPWRIASIVIPPSLGIIIGKIMSRKRRLQS
jgi:hypothetical protein